MNIDWSSSKVQDRLIGIGVVAAFFVVLAAVAGVGLYLTRGPSCAPFWQVPDPNLMVVVYAADMAEQGYIDLNDAIGPYGWISDNGKLKFFAESAELVVFAEACFHDDGIDWNKIEVEIAVP